MLMPRIAEAFWPFSITNAQGVSDSIVHDSSIRLLQAATNSDPNPAKGKGGIATTEGSALIAYAGPAGTIADVDRSGSGGRISTYIVREGDSLSGIADMFDVSINTIMWANNISKNGLKPGMNLIILPVSGVRHTVSKGETLASLAKKYGSDSDEIATYNGLDSGAGLTVGAVVIIPGGELAAAPAPKAKAVAKKTTTASIKTGGSMGAVLPTGDTTRAASSGFANPVPGGRLSQGVHGWNGVDLAAPAGSPIYAAAAGTVIVSRASGWNGGYGNYVVIDHGNGVQTLYSHMSTDTVSVGQSVSRGEPIGTVGKTGQATGYHLHFEVRGAKNPFGS
ncbi:peptidoglycan DD-metalloendopeptidase family protein [Patescibacteria group bacterium]|nr:peptidoglycan DD-metalloendopeptidase family protein [Patescibacteria group bacterium]MBU1500634.1 peptidoglycan DD-metalloendopeptidase family protein [Patescibacteria group bacterium]MBU2080523.1 peptidoglycan DD-metalloendopeptidase family protein [Patescibacteria group bacterium]MBU2123672.1 peptidoglycan DD-metalloendopeptidase family protein [Patescibacteria group bacterium]MBU2194528.1 peptidoglycan DD-metalloendopeptidase family protein [Patescibacteria group bacterium]